MLSLRGQGWVGKGLVVPSTHRCWGWSWDPGSPSFKATGSLWSLSRWLQLGPLCSPPGSCPHAAQGKGGLQAGTAISGPLRAWGGGGGRRSCHLRALFLLPPPSARSTLQTLLQVSGRPPWGGGRRGGEDQAGGASALSPPCGTSAPRTPPSSLRPPQAPVGTSL